MADFTGWGDYANGGAFAPAPVDTTQMGVGMSTTPPAQYNPTPNTQVNNPNTNPSTNLNTFGPGGAFGTVDTRTGWTLPGSNVLTGSPNTYTAPNTNPNAHNYGAFMNYMNTMFNRPSYQQATQTQGYQTPPLQAYSGQSGMYQPTAPLQPRATGPLNLNPYTRGSSTAPADPLAGIRQQASPQTQFPSTQPQMSLGTDQINPQNPVQAPRTGGVYSVNEQVPTYKP